MSIVRTLAEMAPHHILTLVDQLIEHRFLPELVLEFIQRMDNQVTILNNLLSDDTTWLESRLDRIRLPIETICTKLVQDCIQPDLDSNHTCQVLRLLCGCIARFKITMVPMSDDWVQLMGLLTHIDVNSERSVELALALLLLLPQAEQEVSVFRLLIKTSCLVSLLLAVHLWTRKTSQIVKFLQHALGHAIVCFNESHVDLFRQLLTTGIYAEVDLATNVLSLPFERVGSVADECVLELLQDRVFLNHRIQSLRTWLLERMRCPSCGARPAFLLNIIREFVSNVLESPQALAPYSESCIQTFLQDSNISDASRVFMLFYVLWFNHHVSTKRLQPTSIAERLPSQLFEYSDSLMNAFPTKLLLRKLESSAELADVYPPLLGLIAAQQPHLLNPTESLRRSMRTIEASANLLGTDWRLELKNLTSVDRQAVRQALLLSFLRRVRQAPESSLEVETDIVAVLDFAVPFFLEGGVDRTTASVFLDLWLRWSGAFAHALWVPTMRLLLPPSGREGHRHTSVSFVSFLNDPLSLLDCDQRVYRRPVLLRILLEILGPLMVASRQRLHQRMSVNRLTLDDLNGLLLTQESAIVQALLDVCRKQASEADGASLSEIQEIVCMFLHQQFIDNVLLMKLVHFQGYEDELIAVTVDGIPSMRTFAIICLILSFGLIEPFRHLFGFYS